MNIRIPEQLNSIARVFCDAGVPVYAVGGLVRNTLLHLPPSDFDLCSSCTPDALAQLCAGTEVRIIPKAVKFGTVELHAPGGVVTEHTTFRSESYPRGGVHRPDQVRLGGTVETDAFRRDFSVNALYADLQTGEVLDPTGGLMDLEAGVLRTTSADPQDILGSDALRVLRMVRFAAELGFSIEAHTWAAAVQNAPKLKDIAAERRREELNKILLCDGRYLCPLAAQTARNWRNTDIECPEGPGRVITALTRLTELGAWAALIPELQKAAGVQQRRDYHRYDVMEHLLRTCAQMPPILELRLAGLLHDIGKPACVQQTGRMLEHDRYGKEIARRALAELRYPAAVAQQVVDLVENHMYDIQDTAKEDTLRVRFALWGRELTERMIRMREADMRGSGYQTAYMQLRWRALYEKMLTEGAPFSERELAVGGKEISEELGLVPGKDVGRVKRKLFMHCAKRPQDNNEPCLRRLMHDYQ